MLARRIAQVLKRAASYAKMVNSLPPRVTDFDRMVAQEPPCSAPTRGCDGRSCGWGYRLQFAVTAARLPRTTVAAGSAARLGVRTMAHRTALVTGAAGFIGSHLCERLVAEGWRVIGVDSFEDYYPRPYKERNVAHLLAGERFTLHELNLLNLAESSSEGAALLRDSVREADVVYHLAAQAGVRASWGGHFDVYTQNNVLATQLLLEAAKAEGVGRFVYASTSSVYGDTDSLPMREDAVCRPHSPYGVTKLAGEHLCQLYWRNFGVPTACVRFFTVYGPRQRPDMGFHRFIRMMLEGRPIPVYGDGSQTRDFTYVSDIVRGLLASSDAPPGDVCNLGGGSRVSLVQAMSVLGEVMGIEPALEIRETQAGDVRDTWASLRHARRVLSYEPRVSLEDGLAAEVEWLRSLAGQPAFPWGVAI
jgi:nucleoside-diphosphate-sugar epimerase